MGEGGVTETGTTWVPYALGWFGGGATWVPYALGGMGVGSGRQKRVRC